MVRAILFDLGGTLDGDGLHWLDRFVALYRSVGVGLPRETLRAAFDHAERLASQDGVIATAPFEPMVSRHVGWQLEFLNLQDPAIARALVTGFVEPARRAAAANAAMLESLTRRGFSLGVVSNGCGNVDVLCRDLGFADHLSVIVDSRRLGVAKPDPAIFQHAADRLEIDPASTLMVGDSFDRDIRPARLLGMRTAWLEGETARDCPDPSLVDLRLRRLADLATAPLLAGPRLARTRTVA